jgi:outer membrane receptor for ferrienterochelin and colicins
MLKTRSPIPPESFMSRRVHAPVPTALPPAQSLLSAAVALTTFSAMGLAPAVAAEPAVGTAATQIVVVTATRHAMALIDAPASIDIVTPAQIEARGADNVFDAVRGETGMSIQGRTISGRKAINLRGMDSRHTLVLVDGKRIGASDGVVGHSDYQYDWVAIDDIDRIEVIRGPMSVLYGAEALGGVVNVITRKPGERWRVGARVEGSTADDSRGGDGHRVAVQADGPLGGGLALSVSAADVRRQAVANATDPSLTDLEGRRKRDATLRLQWAVAPGHELTAEHRVGDEERWADARERSGRRRLYRSVTPLDRSHRALGWTWEAGGAQDLRTQLRAYRSTLDVGNSRDNGVAALRPQQLDDRVVEGQVSAVPGEAQLSTGGFEWRRESLHNEGLPDGEGHAEHRALYLQHEAAWPSSGTRSLSLTGGLRHDHHSRFGSAWSPRLYLVWQAAPGWTVKGGYGHGFKAPTLKQISADYREDEGPFTYSGNAALVPETNDAVEAGVGWDDRRAGAQLMLFRNQVRHLIITRYTGTAAGRGQYVFENADRATLQGLELAGTLRPHPGWTVGGSWQLLDATDGDGQRLEKRPRHALGLKIDWTADALRAGVRLEHQRGQLLASTTAGQPLQAAPPTTLVSAYAGLDLGHGLDLSLGVNNLGQLDLAQKSPLFVYAEAPRTWRLTLRGRW